MQTGQSKSRILKFAEMLAKVFCFELYTPIKQMSHERAKMFISRKGSP